VAQNKVAILGSAGVPGNYGGFETLADNLVAFHEETDRKLDLTVYCSSKGIDQKLPSYRRAQLRYVSLDANGVQSIPYDILGLIDAILKGHNRLLLLGVAGAFMLPVLRLFSRARIITNVDGIEWKREKWRGLPRYYLRFAERIAVMASHKVIADNQVIADYLKEAYNCDADVIPYGGDHAIKAEPDASGLDYLPDSYALGLCRIVPENNIEMILEAFEGINQRLVFVGNWDKSAYGQELKSKYRGHPNITIHDPIYDPRGLRAIRDRAMLYLHGHSAGGTNPALVEMMHFGIPIAAHGCSFNRHTTEGQALYFRTADELRNIATQISGDRVKVTGLAMKSIARRRYTWAEIGRSYFELLEA